MSLIKVSNLKKYFVDRLILNIDNLEIQNGDKVGLVGANGCGKTTLLNILCGRESYDEGQIHMESSFSYINQFDEEVEISSSRLSKELNLPSCYNDYLSGEEKVKARISKALEENTRLIIVDEPTSNLDVKSIKYLEEKFKVFRGTLLLVSHDREFLDSICNKIIEIDHGQIREYKGNYSNYLKLKEESSFDETFIRIVLARFLFRREDVYKNVGILSGGEKVRAALSMVILSDNNLLILDEPTNYLDIPSMEALEEAISYTNKTMIIVSHDRRFISKVCDEVLIIKDKRLIHYPYSYEEWINKSKEVKISKDKREKEERLMIIRNKITEIISLMSIEKDEAKISKYEMSYEELLRELKTLQS